VGDFSGRRTPRLRSTPLVDVAPSRNSRLDAKRALEPATPRGDGPVPEVLLPAPCSLLPFDGRHDHSRNAARHDALEGGEIGRDVQREAMPRDPLFHMDPDAGDLATTRPHASEAGVPPGGYAELGE